MIDVAMGRKEVWRLMSRLVVRIVCATNRLITCSIHLGTRVPGSEHGFPLIKTHLCGLLAGFRRSMLSLSNIYIHDSEVTDKISS